MSPIFKRVFKRAAIGFALIAAVLLIINGVLAWRAQSRWDAKLAVLRAAGDPVSLADVAPSPIPADKNAATYLQRIAPQLEEFEKPYEKFYGTPLGKDWDQREGNDELPNAEELAAMQAILDAYPSILPTLQQAAACTEYASLLDFELPANQFLEASMSSLREMHHFAHYMKWKCVVLMAEGKSDECIRLEMDMHRLNQLRSHGTLLIDNLVAMSVSAIINDAINQTLRHPPISAQTRVELDAELAKLDNSAGLQRVLRSERAFAIPWMMEQTGSIAAFLRWPTLQWMTSQIDLYDQACQSVGQSWQEIQSHWDALNKEDSHPVNLPGNKVKATLTAAFLAAFEMEVRRLAWIRCVRVLNALGEYHDRTGKEAEGLQQLSLPREATIDPYSGKPLLLKNTDQGWIVYSVGRNGVDDGGKINDVMDGDWGLGPPGYQQ